MIVEKYRAWRSSVRELFRQLYPSFCNAPYTINMDGSVTVYLLRKGISEPVVLVVGKPWKGN